MRCSNSEDGLQCSGFKVAYVMGLHTYCVRNNYVKNNNGKATWRDLVAKLISLQGRRNVKCKMCLQQQNARNALWTKQNQYLSSFYCLLYLLEQNVVFLVFETIYLQFQYVNNWNSVCFEWSNYLTLLPTTFLLLCFDLKCALFTITADKKSIFGRNTKMSVARNGIPLMFSFSKFLGLQEFWTWKIRVMCL